MLAGVFALLAVAAWVSVAIHAILLLPHGKPDVSLVALAFGGYRFFLSSTFEPSGHALHRRLLMSIAAFVAAVAAGAVTGLVLALAGR
jgi:hypothetical protein